MFFRTGVVAAWLLIVTPVVVQLCLALLVFLVLVLLFIGSVSVLLPLQLIYETVQTLLLTMFSTFYVGSEGLLFTGLIAIVWMIAILIAFLNSDRQ